MRLLVKVASEHGAQSAQTFALPVEPEQRMLDVYHRIRERYVRNYLKPEQESSFEIQKLQDAYGADIFLNDSVKDLFGHETAQEKIIVHAIPAQNDRASSVPPTSDLLPNKDYWQHLDSMKTSTQRRQLNDDPRFPLTPASSMRHVKGNLSSSSGSTSKKTTPASLPLSMSPNKGSNIKRANVFDIPDDLETEITQNHGYQIISAPKRPRFNPQVPSSSFSTPKDRSRGKITLRQHSKLSLNNSIRPPLPPQHALESTFQLGDDGDVEPMSARKSQARKAILSSQRTQPAASEGSRWLNSIKTSTQGRVSLGAPLVPMSTLATVGNISSHGTRRGDRWTEEEDDLLLREMAKGTRNNLLVALYFNTRSTEGIRKRKKKLENKYQSRLERLRSIHRVELGSLEIVSQTQPDLSRRRGRSPHLTTMEDESDSEWSQSGIDDDILVHSKLSPPADLHGQSSSTQHVTDPITDEQALSTYSEPVRTYSDITREEKGFSTFEQNDNFAIQQASVEGPEDTTYRTEDDIEFDEELLQSSPFVTDSSPRPSGLNKDNSLKFPEANPDAYPNQGATIQFQQSTNPPAAEVSASAYHFIDDSSTSYRKCLEVYQSSQHANDTNDIIDDEAGVGFDQLILVQESIDYTAEKLGSCDTTNESTCVESGGASGNDDESEESDGFNESDESRRTYSSGGSGYFGYLAEQQLLSDAIQVDEENGEEPIKEKMSKSIEEMAGESDKGRVSSKEPSNGVQQEDKAICLTANSSGNSPLVDMLSNPSARWLGKTPEATAVLHFGTSNEEGIGDFRGNNDESDESDESDNENSVADDRAFTIKEVVKLPEQARQVKEQSEESIDDFEDAMESLEFHDSVQGTMSQAKNIIRDLFSWSHRSRRAE